MTARKKKPEHCVLKGETLLCTFCGRTEQLAMPVRMEVFALSIKLFARDHKNCVETESSPSKRVYKTPREWLAGHDTGISSMTLAWKMTGDHAFRAALGSFRPGEPCDPDDFGRCHRLLELFPEWRARLGEMAEVSPWWGRLAAAWPELTALFIEESRSPTGTAPKLYARMQECEGRAVRVGGSP